MKTIRQILAGYRSNDNNYTIEEAEKELLDLFSVRLSLLAEKAADEATERYEYIQGVDYGNGLEHGFESGAEWIVEGYKCVRAERTTKLIEG